MVMSRPLELHGSSLPCITVKCWLFLPWIYFFPDNNILTLGCFWFIFTCNSPFCSTKSLFYSFFSEAVYLVFAFSLSVTGFIFPWIGCLFHQLFKNIYVCNSLCLLIWNCIFLCFFVIFLFSELCALVHVLFPWNPHVSSPQHSGNFGFISRNSHNMKQSAYFSVDCWKWKPDHGLRPLKIKDVA